MVVLGDWFLTPERAAVHLPTATAVIADLHLGYGEVRCRTGEALPAFGLDETVVRLQALANRIHVRRLLIAGDLFEDGRRSSALAELLAWLHRAGVELAGVIPGNHDRGLHKAPGPMTLHPDGVELGGWRVLHGDGHLPPGRVVHGHLHPCLRWREQIAAPCYLVGAERLILPAFSADAAGVNVLGDRRWRSLRCWVPTGERVLDFGEVGTLPERLSAVQEVT
jgi:putative SbcD/Mre11-related phosphoesterase